MVVLAADAVDDALGYDLATRAKQGTDVGQAEDGRGERAQLLRQLLVGIVASDVEQRGTVEQLELRVGKKDGVELVEHALRIVLVDGGDEHVAALAYQRSAEILA